MRFQTASLTAIDVQHSKFPSRPAWASAKGAQALGPVQMSTLIGRVVMHSRAWFITGWWGGVVKALTWSLVCFAWSLNILITPSYVSACDLWGLPLWGNFEQGLISLNRCRCPVLTSFAFLINHSRTKFAIWGPDKSASHCEHHPGSLCNPAALKRTYLGLLKHWTIQGTIWPC